MKRNLLIFLFSIISLSVSGKEYLSRTIFSFLDAPIEVHLITGKLDKATMTSLKLLDRNEHWAYNMLSVAIGSEVTDITNFAFNNCSNLVSATIPDSVTHIGLSSFGNCLGLARITIPRSVRGIGPAAFFNCDSLKELTIPDSVRYISEYALVCKSLMSVTFEGRSMEEVREMEHNDISEGDWGLPRGCRIHCIDGDIIVQ